MKYVFDIDGTLTTSSTNREYAQAIPDKEAIAEVNRLYDEGHHITLFTARGAGSGINWHDLTVRQMNEWGIKHHQLIDKGKPSWDIFVDDKAISAEEWRTSFKPKIIGFVASAFDLLHPGHCVMLRDAKKQCTYLIAALQSNPRIDRPKKNEPVMTLHERQIMLESNKYVDKIILYETDEELKKLLALIKPDVRILGDDYIGNEDAIVGREYCKQIYFHNRSSHGWSTTHFRKRITGYE